jgi:hypothetical protein
MRRRVQNLDPYWITVKFVNPAAPPQCGTCKKRLVIGERVFYYPSTKTMLCMKDPCGIQASKDFNAAAFDEAQMGGRW